MKSLTEMFSMSLPIPFLKIEQLYSMLESSWLIWLKANWKVRKVWLKA